MATDVFNNPSNDYVNPGLAPCAGVPDGNSGEFKFIDDGAGVVVGSDIVQFMDLSGLSIDVTEWSGRKQTLQSGEVIYVPGPDKGLLNRKQAFRYDDVLPSIETNQQYYFIIDLSISYYNNFRHYNVSLDASANYSLNLDIDDALNVVISNNSIKTEVTYDASYFTFEGTQLGYEYDISNVELTLIDASMDSTSPFPAIIVDGERVPQTFTLTEDSLLALPASKYPNGAMLGYVFKADYPSDECYRDWWLYMNHVVSPYDVYVQTDLITEITDISINQSTTFDASVQFGPFVNDVSVSVKDVSCVDTSYSYDPSYGLPITYNALVDNSTLTYALYGESVITNSIIEYSGIFDFRVADASQYRIEDSSVYGSDLYDNNVGSVDPESYIVNSFITDSSLTQVDVSACTIQKSYARLSVLENSDVVCMELIEDSSIFKSNILSFSTLGNDFYESGFKNMILNGSGVYDSSVLDSSLVSTTISGSYVQDSDVSAGSISSSKLENTVLFNSYITDSSIKDSPIQRDTSIYNSTIQNSWFNAYVFAPGIWTDDVSPGIIEVHGGKILDTSIYNTTVYDAEIYTSNVYDSSLIRCTLYNTETSSTYVDDDSSILKIDSTCVVDVSYGLDSSTYYEKFSKVVNVGMSGCGDTTTLSAADYLDYINSNDLWFKVGQFASRFTAPDIPENSQKNLIGGFYLFNPQTFPVNVEYMILNKVES